MNFLIFVSVRFAVLDNKSTNHASGFNNIDVIGIASGHCFVNWSHWKYCASGLTIGFLPGVTTHHLVFGWVALRYF
jgi:hypothetical protein